VRSARFEICPSCFFILSGCGLIFFMPIFLSTFINKLDKKGRVSVPAAFRSALSSDGFQGAVALRSYAVPAVEVFGGNVMERLVEQVDHMDMFSEERQNFTATLFSDSELLSFDSEGRIALSEVLLSHAQIHERVAFVGCGTHFQIWEPEIFAKIRENARKKLKNEGLTLPLKDLRTLPKGEQ